jgi:hypothetical protein
MGKESLGVPEEDLEETIRIIRAGLIISQGVTPRVRKGLERWCREGEEYLQRMKEED